MIQQYLNRFDRSEGSLLKEPHNRRTSPEGLPQYSHMPAGCEALYRRVSCRIQPVYAPGRPFKRASLLSGQNSAEHSRLSVKYSGNAIRLCSQV